MSETGHQLGGVFSQIMVSTPWPYRTLSTFTQREKGTVACLWQVINLWTTVANGAASTPIPWQHTRAHSRMIDGTREASERLNRQGRTLHFVAHTACVQLQKVSEASELKLDRKDNLVQYASSQRAID